MALTKDQRGIVTRNGEYASKSVLPLTHCDAAITIPWHLTQGDYEKFRKWTELMMELAANNIVANEPDPPPPDEPA